MGKVIAFFVLVILIIALILLGGKVYLLAKMFLGNDLVVKVSTENENLFIVNGEQKEIKFKSQVIVNPFCNSQCSYQFTNLDNGEIIETGSFSINPAKTVSKTIKIKANDYGFGQSLYSYSVKCKSTKTNFCQTKEEEKIRNILVTVNYDLSEDNKKIKNESKEQISAMLYDLNYMILNIENINSTIDIIDYPIDFDSEKDSFDSLYLDIIKLNNTIYELIDLWNNQKYSELKISAKISENNVYASMGKFIFINNSINNNIKLYNNLIDNLTISKEKLIILKQSNVSSSNLAKINELILEFNNNLIYFGQKNNSLTDKKVIIESFMEKIEQLIILINNENEKCCFADELINEINFVNLPQIQEKSSSINLEFKEPISKCCFNNKCEECCNNECYQNEQLFPIIFIHGHDFSKGVSAERSLDTFSEIQISLENENYINAGTFILESKEKRVNGILGIPKNPVSLRTSYYFDINENLGQGSVIQTKTNDINNYAIRLNDIIEEVRLKTNREKVIVVAHSMGGLVTRRYMQIFGDNKIDKIIMIGTPNKGISGRTKNYCPIFGSKLECDDMEKTSLFMSKLNNAQIPKVKMYNIIGTGCATNNEDGDGVVEKSSAYLDFAENYYVNGRCDDTKLIVLHNDLIQPDKYPEVLNIINEILDKAG